MNAQRKDGTESYIGVRQAAEYLSLSVNTIYQYVSRGEIPYWKLRGYGLRFLRSELALWQAGELEGGHRGAVPAGQTAVA